jgi:hypothetical protein
LMSGRFLSIYVDGRFDFPGDFGTRIMSWLVFAVDNRQIGKLSMMLDAITN